MTKLDAIRKRWTEATPGPWEVDKYGRVIWRGEYGTLTLSDSVVVLGAGDYGENEDHGAIAHAPTDIAALLEAVEAAREADRAIATAVERDGLSVIPPSIQEELMRVHLALAKLTAEVEE